MNKGFNEKNGGITLIALVVTIVVLLILAGVSLNAVIGNSGIITRTQEASKETDIAETREQILMELMGIYAGSGDYTNDDVIEAVKKVMGDDDVAIEVGQKTVTTAKGNEVDISDLWVKGIWVQDKTSVTNGIVTLEVGQEVTGYPVIDWDEDWQEYYGSEWRVLGAENGILLITTAECPESCYMYMNSFINYEEVIEKMNKKSLDFISEDMSFYARAMTVNDVNRITGHIPVDSDISPLSDGLVSTLGNEATYTLSASDGKVHYIGTIYPIEETISNNSSNTSFRYWDGESWKYLAKGESISFVCSGYSYDLETYSDEDGYSNEINGSEIAYWLLATGLDTTLASTYELTSAGCYTWGLFVAGFNEENGCLCVDGGWHVPFSRSNGTYGTGDMYFRPVVYVNENVNVSNEGVMSIE